MLNTKVAQKKESTKTALTELIPLTQVKAIESQLYIKYDFAMDLLGMSKHINQRLKRQSKYPQHIKTDNNCYFISLDYLEALYAYQLNQKQLKLL